MTQANHFFINHGVWALFSIVFLEQTGLPLPAPLLLLAAGALSVTGQFNALLGIGVTLLACLLADGMWFYLGRYRGNHVLGFLCRVSLEPDSCIRRTQNSFSKYGVKGIVVSKFVPGFSTMAPPLAGMSGMTIGSFLLADGVGALIYGGVFIGLGFLFSNQIQQIESAISQVGGSALTGLLILVAAYIGVKYWHRQKILRELRIARITVPELRKKQTDGEDLVILDLRSSLEFENDGTLISGAVRFGVDEVEHRHHEIPRDRDVIVYCSCPNEVTSARIALLLRRKGIHRVRPLLGGIEAWRERDYPLSTIEAVSKTP